MKKLGIMGDGQLAYFLAQAAINLKVPVVVFVKNNQSPISQLDCVRVVDNSQGALQQFLDQVDILTFENEFIEMSSLTSFSGDIYPSHDCMKTLQNKLIQKQLMSRLDIPTSPFIVFKNEEDFLSLSQTRHEMGPLVYKWSCLGYDGKGVLIENEKTSQDDILKFCREAFQKNIAVYAEKKVAYVKELALVASRDAFGNFVSYELVQTKQHHGVCQWVFSDKDISHNLCLQAEKVARKLAEDMNYRGTFAVEFFLDFQGNLLVNEVAPRVHNSGHYSLNASSVSQFENHVRAVMGMKVETPCHEPYFAMLNILAPEGIEKNVEEPEFFVGPQEYVYWYGKSYLKPGRKMGHVNLCASNQELLNERMKYLESLYGSWVQKLQSINSEKL